MLTLNDGRSELWQWDTGRKLTVDAECSQVHFSNKVFGRSVDVDVENREAAIPDVLLQSEKDIYAWAFVGTPENGYTKISRIFKVNRRNKPADYVFTPEEQMTIQEIKDIAQSVRDDADSGKFDGRDGRDGKDGVPATHEWSETTLIVTSASGTSSANLKGEKGDRGSKGDRGEPGEPGKTPIKGDDYWTDADKQEIVDEVLGEVPQDDWEQNDPNAPDYIKNRPFGEEVTETVLLPETVAECGGEMDSWSTEVDFTIAAGETYIVEVDGTKYECVAEGGEFAYLVFGDFGIEQDSDFFVFYSNIGAVTVTLKISHIERSIKKIDAKYLDMDAIKDALPTVELTATYDDGTTQTYNLYGEAVV